MKCVSKKSKKGFTLIEIMLSIAIITIISGLFVALLVAIKDSYLNVYNADDSTDYAMLFAQGFENSFLGTVQDTTETHTVSWKVDNSQLYRNSTVVFATNQMKTTTKGTNNVKDKWKIEMTYEYDGTNTISYHIDVIDNYYNPGQLTCKYDGSFAILHFDNGTITVTDSGHTIKYKPS